jgi:hypothetical protein
MDTGITIESVVHAARGLIAHPVEGRMALFDRVSRQCYRLDEVGSRVWELLQSPVRVDRVRDALVSEYDVGREACERDLLALLGELAGSGLVELVAARGPAHAQPQHAGFE